MSAAIYDVVPCPSCHGSGENPKHDECRRCEGYGGVEVCRATWYGQRETHDRHACSHYGNVGQPL